MKIKTKRDLINWLRAMSEKQIKRGILYKELSLSIEQRKDEKSLKEWKKFIKDLALYRDDLDELKGGIRKNDN